MNIWTAVEKEDVAAIKLYSERGGDLSTGVSLYGKTPLFFAMEHDRKNSYRAFLDLGANPNVLMGKGWSVMHKAAENADPYWLKEALAAKGNPDLVSINTDEIRQSTPLWHAISANRIENVRLLLDAGADINKYVRRTLTPFAYACSLPPFEIALLLIERRADYLKPAKMGETALFHLRQKVSLAKQGVYTDNERATIRKIAGLINADGTDLDNLMWDLEKSTWKKRK